MIAAGWDDMRYWRWPTVTPPKVRRAEIIKESGEVSVGGSDGLVVIFGYAATSYARR
jgi:hypothetical protein